MIKAFARHCVLLMGLLLAACSPQVQPRMQAVQQAELSADAFKTADGAVLPVKVWASAQERPDAVIIALHGFNDYSNAFRLPGEYLSAHGITVLAFDQRGFGATGMSGIWGGRENLIADVHDMIAAMHSAYPGVPLYLLGESMGGAVAINAAAAGNTGVDGIIVSAPALWGGSLIYEIYHAALWTVAHTFPEKRFTGKDLKILATDNIPLLQAMAKDPLVQKSARADAIYGLVGMMQEAYANIGQLDVPMLILYGRRDQVIPPTPIEMAVAGIRQAGCTVIYYPEGYHMLMRDVRAARVDQDIVDWVRKMPQQGNLQNHSQQGCATYVRPF